MCKNARRTRADPAKSGVEFEGDLEVEWGTFPGPDLRVANEGVHRGLKMTA